MSQLQFGTCVPGRGRSFRSILERLSERRVKEAIATGADVLAVSCPYEIYRFEDALKVIPHDKPMIVRDIVELLAESLGD